MTDNNKNYKIEEDRALLKEQNNEYAESLAKDLAKKHLKEKEKQRIERKKKIEDYREKLNGVQHKGPLRIMLRFPDGQRKIVGFSNEDKLDNLFDAAISHPSCPNYFFIRSVFPQAEVQCHPTWYQKLVEEESDGEIKSSNMELKSFNDYSIANNSILFINMIH